jgi:hypothetical protein
MSWTIPETSLNGAAVTANGTVIDLEEVKADHAIEVVVNLTAANAQPQIWLLGSLDGTNYYSLNTPAGNPIYTVPPSSPAGTYIVMVLVTGQPARYIQATADGPSGCATVTTTHTSSSGG